MGIVTAAAVIGGVAAVGSAVAGADAARRGGNAARRAAEYASRVFGDIAVPSIEEQQIILQTPELMGEYTPEQIEAMQMGVSAMEQVQTDPEAARLQEDALAKMSEVAEGGMTAGDEAAMREMQRDVGQSDVARRKSILNDMAQRGVLGSGMELAAQLQGQQESAESAAEASDRAIQQAQARSLAAMSQQGQMAGKLRAQDFGEKSDVARAKDAITEFNLANRQRVADTNIGERNRAQQANLAARQSLENTRAATQNRMEERNKALIQGRYDNEMSRAAAITGAQYQRAESTAKSAAAGAKQFGEAAGGIADIASIYGKPKKEEDEE